jgi:hypothetical protein
MIFFSVLVILGKPLETIALKQPDYEHGETVLTALKNRRSERDFSKKPLDIQDLSELL